MSRRPSIKGNWFVIAVVASACSAAYAQQVFYVAPVAQGAGNGLSASSAAQYRSQAFWQGVQAALQQGPVTVRFIDGTYADDTLYLTRIGHPEHTLTLRGSASGGAVFNSNFNWNIRLRGSQNIIFEHLRFTGDVNNFALHMQDYEGTPTRQIMIQNCRFIDLPDAQYGAIGITFQTHDVTIRNNTFQRVGKGAGAHMIYTDHGPYNIYVHQNHFEDIPGDYVRFRDEVGYFEVIGNTFLSTKPTLNRPFVSMPIFNDVNPGDEFFSTSMVIRDNRFEYHPQLPRGIDPAQDWYGQAISFANFGFNSPGYTFQLTPQQAQALEEGDIQARIALLKQLTGIDLEQVFIEGNEFIYVPMQVTYGSLPQYGAPSSGWRGFIDITELVTGAHVPEPSAAALLLTGMALMLRRHARPAGTPAADLMTAAFSGSPAAAVSPELHKAEGGFLTPRGSVGVAEQNVLRRIIPFLKGGSS